MKKIRKRKLKTNVIIPILIILIIITMLVVCCFKIKKSSNRTNMLVGTWTTDDVTVYKFNKDNTGSLILPLSTYKFNYKIDKNNLSIDFENEKSEDSKYTYSFKEGKLILKGKNGKFVFKKKK